MLHSFRVESLIYVQFHALLNKPYIFEPDYGKNKKMLGVVKEDKKFGIQHDT